METDDTRDHEIVARLRRLDASGPPVAPAFDYDGMLARHDAAGARARRRQTLARGMASALAVALVGASVWRFSGGPAVELPQRLDGEGVVQESTEPRIVRADNYLALAALEDHIARVDDALSVARVYAPRGAEVARLERTRAELVDSYAQVRYAELVSANY
jgi:hypothetical protein